MIEVRGVTTPLIDADVHESLTSVDVLLPYLKPVWQRYFTECNFRGMPSDLYVATAHGGRRVDSWPETGGPPGSDYGLLAAQLFDEQGIDYAILTGHIYRISHMPQVDFAVALCSAYNDWVVDEWLARDQRLYASLQLPLQDPAAAAREIDRLGPHPQIAQALFPEKASRAFGDPSFDVVYEAVVRNRLAVALHPSGSTGPPPTLIGTWPRTYMELHVNFALTYQSQLASMVCDGTFVKFPDLRVVMLEAGFAWLPHVLWTLDVHWRSLQLEVPWLTRRPSDYVREQVYFGTQPMIVPDNLEHFHQILAMIDADHRLLYASDYPHWDFDAPGRVFPRGVADEAKTRIYGRNALELYGMPEPVNKDQTSRPVSAEA